MKSFVFQGSIFLSPVVVWQFTVIFLSTFKITITFVNFTFLTAVLLTLSILNCLTLRSLFFVIIN